MWCQLLLHSHSLRTCKVIKEKFFSSIRSQKCQLGPSVFHGWRAKEWKFILLSAKSQHSWILMSHFFLVRHDFYHMLLGLFPAAHHGPLTHVLWNAGSHTLVVIKDTYRIGACVTSTHIMHPCPFYPHTPTQFQSHMTRINVPEHVKSLRLTLHPSEPHGEESTLSKTSTWTTLYSSNCTYWSVHIKLYTIV